MYLCLQLLKKALFFGFKPLSLLVYCPLHRIYDDIMVLYIWELIFCEEFVKFFADFY